MYPPPNTTLCYQAFLFCMETSMSQTDTETAWRQHPKIMEFGKKEIQYFLSKTCIVDKF